ncbi:bombyxin A-1 homolog isoform X2 [Colias croceus]|nr:bombyxin A-1 homolog isoform X2 [Colias croceus]
MFSQSLSLFAMLISVCTGHIGGEVSLQMPDVSPQVYCGKSLANAIALFCYNGNDDYKRSESGSVYNSILSPYYKERDNQLGWPWMTSQRARSMTLPSRGKREHIVNECCYKACSINELMSYCQN